MRRLARLARVREVERRRAVGLAAASGDHQARLQALALRSGELAQGYAGRADALDGASLAALFAFRHEMAELSARARDDAATARLAADRAGQDLAAAERRRELVSERLQLLRRAEEQRFTREEADLARNMKGAAGERGAGALSNDRTTS